MQIIDLTAALQLAPDRAGDHAPVVLHYEGLHYEAVGKALKNAQSAYDNGKGKLAVKGQSIVHSAQKLIDLGANNNRKTLPPMLDVDEV